MAFLKKHNEPLTLTPWKGLYIVGSVMECYINNHHDERAEMVVLFPVAEG